MYAHHQAAGGLAVIVVDNTDGPLVLMNSRGMPSYDITIPAIFISKADGNLMKDMVEGQLASFGTVCLSVLLQHQHESINGSFM